jgi:peptidoglycan-N-acetylglucosamine deacetylase
MRIFIFSVVLAFAVVAQGQTLALTFDDGLDPEREPKAREWNRQLLDGLASTEITAMIFPALSRVGGAPGRALVAEWSRSGHYVGNHTSGHRNLGSKRLTLAEFIQDVLEADQAFNRLPTWLPMLRFPYLKEGDTAEKRDGMREWLRTNGYRAAPVSIDTSDWYFNQVWLKLQAPADAQKLAALQREYIEHLLARADYYQALAKRTLDRTPMHVMLLHVNAINAASIQQIAKAFHSRGWNFASPVKAFADPLYSEQPMTLPAGESIVWALAKEKGESGLRYPAEDAIYEKPVLRAKGLLPAADAK